MALPVYWRQHGRRTSDDLHGRYGHCARCGGELLRVILAPDPEIRASHGWHWLTPLCGQCATPEELAYAHVTGECPGCGLGMSFSPRDAMTTRWVACSDRCYQRAWRRSRRMKTLTCEVCRLRFQSARKDARFCSNACRQRHYRAGLQEIADALDLAQTQQRAWRAQGWLGAGDQIQRRASKPQADS